MLAYMYASMACKLSISFTIKFLFVDRRCYFYKTMARILGVIAYHVQQYQRRCRSLYESINGRRTMNADMTNLLKYMKKEKELLIQKGEGTGHPFSCLSIIDSESVGEVIPTEQEKQEKEVEHVKMTREQIKMKAKGMM
jgi:hypothetical protein